MSRFKNEVSRLEAHVMTLRIGVGLFFVVAILMGLGWWSAPRDMTVHVPPDLRSGSTRKWWEVPPETVYTFGFYIFQQLNRWPTNGEEDYPRNLRQLAPFLTPGCKTQLEAEFEERRAGGELRKRTRGVYEIPERGYSDNPTLRVKTLGNDAWIVNLDLTADEYYGSEKVKRALVRYPLHVIRMDTDPERNPFGLLLNCYSGKPQRLSSSVVTQSPDTSLDVPGQGVVQ
ncbi:PFL_4703 family integrating conjugative element protein [Pseudomonas quasicaspiana]|uniref:PFL_4703 family integrating conjugative element protein n=1 Tax=Pseudomonas quasicaspiana TaxID=2829821 RepID=UPI000EFE61EF|nr:TIGR03746 family integrating conjugative element protein [Pseudomonas quasicaspiana]MCD5976774.1 TIGR03746 family integrating conjugative element protein [Pseudomonas quasicaspiana]